MLRSLFDRKLNSTTQRALPYSLNECILKMILYFFVLYKLLLSEVLHRYQSWVYLFLSLLIWLWSDKYLSTARAFFTVVFVQPPLNAAGTKRSMFALITYHRLMDQAHANITTYEFWYLLLRSVKRVDVLLQRHFVHVQFLRDVQFLKEKLQLLRDSVFTYNRFHLLSCCLTLIINYYG